MNAPLEINDGRRDLDRAVTDLAARLPGPLVPLARLVFNYRWTWLPGAAELLHEVDPAIWRHSEGNPRAILEAVSPLRLADLANEPSFVQRVQGLAQALDADLSRPCAGPIAADRPVAYLCSEFGVHCSLPLYGGGLGVLAGDLLKAASDLALPMVGVGLLYRQGYFHQRFTRDGWQIEYWTTTTFERLPVVLVTGPDRCPITVDVPIRDRQVRVQIWRAQVGRVPLYLLDTDRDDNLPIDRWITARLYVGDRQTRLAQYAILGIGAIRALAALGITPSLVHLNEGHPALSSFERLRCLIDAGHSIDAALETVRSQTVFTTHTPVAAGNEAYREDEVEPVLHQFIGALGSARQTFYDLGRLTPGDRQEPASITPLALRTSGAANAVSRRHGEVARAMWHPLWRDRSEADVPIRHVTNGVHATTWMAGTMQRLLDRHLGPQWRRHLADTAMWAKVLDIPDAELWRVRCEQRAALVQFVREQSVRNRLDRGEPLDYVEAAALAFDPQVLTVGFARRMATYKRFYLLTRYPDRGVRLLADGPMPIQVVVAGKAHPQDGEAKEALRGFFQLKEIPNVGRRIVFLEDYDLHVAPRAVSGVDLWLNLPRPPFEASGTSGMKVALNGGLNLSVLDGWWAEAYDGENGWAIASPPGDPRAQDDHDAWALLDLLELQVIPLFHKRDGDGIPRGWVQRIKAAMVSLIPRFSAERMLHEYVAEMYAPLGNAPGRGTQLPGQRAAGEHDGPPRP
jgi:starch phosphorylase